MKTFAIRKSLDNWVVPVSALGLVLGFMIATAWATNDGERSRAAYGRTGLATPAALVTEKNEDETPLADEVKKLREEKTRLEKTLGERGDEGKVLNDNLQAAKLFGGLTDVQGPGVRIILRDSTKSMGDVQEGIIHDLDVMRVVNELFSAGAEAISVNDHRISGGSSFRCVGPVILVNDVKIATPVVIRAIGDSKTMLGGILMPGGILTDFKEFDPGMVQTEAMKTMRLPAYVGRTTRTFATVPKEKG